MKLRTAPIHAPMLPSASDASNAFSESVTSDRFMLFMDSSAGTPARAAGRRQRFELARDYQSVGGLGCARATTHCQDNIARQSRVIASSLRGSGAAAGLAYQKPLLSS